MYRYVLPFLCLLATPSLGSSQDFDREDAFILSFFLRQSSVIDELELVESQKEDIGQVSSKMEEVMNDWGTGGLKLKLMGDPEALEKRKDEIRDQFIEIGNSFAEQLLPHQQKRMNQLYLRFKIFTTEDGLPHVFLSEKISGLNLKDTDKSTIKVKVGKYDEELKALLARHRKELIELAERKDREILESLDQEQVTILQQQLGEGFSFDESMSRMAGGSKASKNEK